MKTKSAPFEYRMADRLLRDGFLFPEWVMGSEEMQLRDTRDHINFMVTDAQVIDASNVAEYLYAQTAQEHWDITKDFPNLAPPYPLMWVEYGRPSKLISEDHGEQDARFALPKKCGVLFHSIQFDHLAEAQNVLTDDYNQITAQCRSWEDARALMTDAMFEFHTLRGLQTCITQSAMQSVITYTLETEGARFWAVRAYIFAMTDDNKIAGPLQLWTYFVNKDGAVIGEASQSIPFSTVPVSREFIQGFEGFIFAPLLAITFMHCKNVVLIENKPPASMKKRAARSGKKAPIRYHTLKINPIKKVIADAQASESQPTGIRQGLHIARGHFKHYVTRGLFGKHYGTYWFSNPARGDVDEGIIVKDYQAPSPEVVMQNPGAGLASLREHIARNIEREEKEAARQPVVIGNRATVEDVVSRMVYGQTPVERFIKELLGRR